MTTVENPALGEREALRRPLGPILDRIEQALLTANIARGARAAMIRSLENDLLTEVQRRTATPTAEDVSTLLTDMGLAASAGRAVVNPAGLRGRELREYLRSLAPRRSRCAFWGGVCVALSLLPVVGFLVFFMFFSPAGLHVETHFFRDDVRTAVGAGPLTAEQGTLLEVTGPDGTMRATTPLATPRARLFWLFTPIIPLAVAATLLGIVGVLDIVMSRGRVTGMAPALFVALFYPILLVTLFFAIG